MFSMYLNLSFSVGLKIKKLQVTDKDLKPWANGKIFAVGDCNFGCIGNPFRFTAARPFNGGFMQQRRLLQDRGSRLEGGDAGLK